MESIFIEMGCPADFNLSKFVQQPSKQDNSHTYTSDYSESTDEETDNNDDLIDQFKQLSFTEAPDSKYITPKPTNKSSEANFQEEVGSREPILVENKDVEDIQSPSFSFKDEESLKFVAKADGESTFRNCLNKNCGIYSKKKSDTEKVNFEDNLESVENQLSSLYLKNNKIFYRCCKINYGISDDDESDSDYDEQGESVTLRERGHTKHNRPQNNRQQRPVPFTQNASTSGHHFNPNCLQTFENFSPPVLYGRNTPHDGCNSSSHTNSNDLETYRAVHSSSITLYSDFPTSEWETYETFGSVTTSTGTDEVVNNGVPYTEEAVPEYFVPSEEDTRNLNDQFSSETNDTSLFENSNERSFSCYSEVNEETENSSDSGLENLTEEEFLNILGNFTDSTSDDLSRQNPLDTSNENLMQFSNEDLNIISVFSDSPIPDQNFHPSSTTLYSDFPTSEWETYEIFGSVTSSTGTDEVLNNGVPYAEETVPEYALPFEEDTRNLKNQFSSEPNDISLFDSSNGRSFSDYAEGYVETENSSDSGLENLTEEEFLNTLGSFIDSTSDHLSGQNPVDISNENLIQLSDEDLDIISVSSESSLPYQNGIQSIEVIYPKNNHEEVQPRNNINQTNTSSNRTEETQIYTLYGTSARAVLFNSSPFCKTKWDSAYEDIKQQIQSGKLGTEEKTVIHMIPKSRKTKYRGTNLHYAIREEKIEKVFCLMECHKACHGSLNTEINLRDNSNKTVLDYSKEKKLDLLTAYLEENEAKSFSNICN